MRSKLRYLLILLCLFVLAFVFKKYQFFPYKIVHQIYFKVSNNYFFSKNKNCLMSNNLGANLNGKKDYTFFIAGHAFGSPTEKNLGIYPKFYKELINKKNIFDFGIFAGDVTREGDDRSFDYFDDQIENLNLEIYIAPGNHDIGFTYKRNFFTGLYGKKKKKFIQRYNNLYQSFKFKNDLFIILNPYDRQWSIKSEQLEFLKKQLKNNYELVDNIVIITHPVIYINKKFNVKPNNFLGAGKILNFWDVIYPTIKKFNNNYYIVSGDVGAYPNANSLFCKKFENSLFLATGMGGGIYDNYLVFKKVNNRLIIELEKF